MNTPQMVLRAGDAKIGGLPALTHANFVRFGQRCGPALRVFGIIALIVLAGALSTAAFGANPFEEAAKGGTTVTGGVDPHGDSWQSIHNSLVQFGQPQFVLRLLLSFLLAVACAWVVGWHPRRASFGDPLADHEERKTLLILGLVGAVVVELSAGNPTMAFVIFGIGALLRFRTALDNPKLTGKAIMVVIIGLACGMGSWVMAIFVTAFTWILICWIESRVGCQMRVRLDDDLDPEPAFGVVQSLLVSRGCQIQSSELNKGKGQMVFKMLIPAGLDPNQLEADVRAKLPQPDDARIDIDAA